MQLPTSLIHQPRSATPLELKGAGDPQRYVTLARFFAENISVQAASLERTVMDSAEAVNGADAVLLG